MKNVIYVIAGVLGVSTAGFAMASRFGSDHVTDGFIYETAAVSVGEIRKVVTTSGVVRPRMTVSVGSEISGRIKTIVADYNAVVNAGDLLAVIEPRTFESKAKQAKADLLSAEAALSNSEAAVRKAQSVLAAVEKVFERQRALGRNGIASAANVDTSERDLNVARAEVDVAIANHENAKAVVAQKLAQLEQAQIDLERTQIRAPIGGVVLDRSVGVGQTVAASFQAPELFRLAGDLSLIHIEAQVSEADVGSVRSGQPVTFDVDAYSGKAFRGRVEQIRLSPSAAESVVTYTVVIEADNPKLELFPGMTANVRIETARRENVVRAPAEAIRFKLPKSARQPVAEAPLWDRGLTWVRDVTGSTTGKETGTSLASEAASANPAGGKDGLIRRMTKQLQLTDAQVTEVTERLRQLTASGVKKSSGQAKGGVPAGSDDPSAEIIRALDPVLSPDQRTRLAAILAEGQGKQHATVWVLKKDGAIEKHSVHVGISDIKSVEVMSGSLRPGDEVIVRSRKAKS